MPLAKAPDSVRQRDAQGLREPEQGKHGHVVLGPFDSADVGPMHSGLKRQLLLRKSTFFAGLPQILADPHQHRVLGFSFLLGHTLKVRYRTVDIDSV